MSQRRGWRRAVGRARVAWFMSMVASACDSAASVPGAIEDASALHDAAAQDAEAHDAEVQDGDEAGPSDGGIPEVDANFPAAVGPADLAFAETTFELVKPAALAPFLGQAAQLLGENKLFVNEYRAQGARFIVEYGAADALTSADLRWQFPATAESDTPLLARGRLWADPMPDAARSYRSAPFTYRLLARAEVLLSNVYVAMDVRDAVYEASFDADFRRIEHGSLKGVLTRKEAEQSPLEAGPLCADYCPADYCLSHGVSNLADVLDCQDAIPDVDRNHDGTADAYTVEMEFSSRRVRVQPHQDDD